MTAVKPADYTVASWNAYQVVVAANVVTASNTQTQVNACDISNKNCTGSLVKTASVNVKTTAQKVTGLRTIRLRSRMQSIMLLRRVAELTVPDGTYLIDPDTKIKT